MFSENVRHITEILFTGWQQRLQNLPDLWRKPLVFRHWLLSAHLAQFITLVILLLIPFAIIPLINSLLEIIFTPVMGETLFGLIKTQEKNPYIDNVQLIVFWIVWIFSTLLCFVFFLRHIPDALEHARMVVKEKELKADLLMGSNPSKSILLYDMAKKWSISEESETNLKSKLLKANAAAYEAGKKTLVMSTKAIELTSSIGASENAVIAERYKIIKLIGSGAMGNVYQAEDILLKREVALKQLSPQLSHDEKIIARFRQEALALARLSHPNIVQVYDFIEGEGFLWIIMELVTGGELEGMFSTTNPLPLNEALRLTQQMAAALSYAHQQGVVHRDFKPANILMTNDGDVKITDFGIAKLAQSSLHTQLNTVMGTPSHMSPEQANGEPTDQRTDIYALGVVVYEMLCGELPFQGDVRAIISQHLTKPAPSLREKNKNITSAIDDLVQKMLAKDPKERFQSMDELTKQLPQ